MVDAQVSNVLHMTVLVIAFPGRRSKAIEASQGDIQEADANQAQSYISPLIKVCGFGVRWRSV